MLSRLDGYASLAHRLLSRFNRYLGRFMPQPPLDPPVADTPPNAETLTPYDEEHLVTYLRLLDAEADGADWTEVARLVLHIDPSREPARARRAWESHLARAKWMTKHGYQHLLRGSAPG
jgi:T6SS, Transcription factor, DNA binding domain